MSEFQPITDADLARARSDPGFRHDLLANSLDCLLSELNRLKRAHSEDPAIAGQMREAVALAVKLSDRIRRLAKS